MMEERMLDAKGAALAHEADQKGNWNAPLLPAGIRYTPCWHLSKRTSHAISLLAAACWWLLAWLNENVHIEGICIYNGQHSSTISSSTICMLNDAWIHDLHQQCKITTRFKLSNLPGNTFDFTSVRIVSSNKFLT